MSRHRQLVSVVLAWHVIAVVIGAVPAPAVDPLPAVPLPRDVSDDPVAARVAPILDSVLDVIAPVPSFLWRMLRPVRPAVDLYLSALHLPQRWSMFADPPKVDQYVRVRVYAVSAQPDGAAAPPRWMATELVLPAHREDVVRTFQSFRDSSRDKAIAIALDDFHRVLNWEIDRTGSVPRELPDSLTPIARYFASEFERNHLTDVERIERVEVWYGRAVNPPRGDISPDAREARRKALDAYHQEPVRIPVSATGRRPYGTSEQEVDITWTLEYFEDR